MEVADRWIEVVYHDHGIAQGSEPHLDPLLRSNFWLVRGSERDLVFDSGSGLVRLREQLPEWFENEPLLVLSHSHFDHIGGAWEFDERLAHPAEAEAIAHPEPGMLRADNYPPDFVAGCAELGMPLPEVLVDRLPAAGFEPGIYEIPPAPITALVEDGDRIDLGNRTFEVLHLPGHSPGGIGLYEMETGILLAGDTVYDGPLLDSLPGGDPGAYRASLKRLRNLAVTTVHGGHDPSFDSSRLNEICDGYLGVQA